MHVICRAAIIMVAEYTPSEMEPERAAKTAQAMSMGACASLARSHHIPSRSCAFCCTSTLTKGWLLPERDCPAATRSNNGSKSNPWIRSSVAYKNLPSSESMAFTSMVNVPSVLDGSLHVLCLTCLNMVGGTAMLCRQERMPRRNIWHWCKV